MVKARNKRSSRPLGDVLGDGTALSPGAETVLWRVFWRPSPPVAPRVAEVWRLPLPEGTRRPAT